MHKLIILDYAANSVDIYDVDPSAIIDEERLEDMGYKQSQCEWMLSTEPLITYHKEVLK